MTRTKLRDRFGVGALVGDYRIQRVLRSEQTGVVYLATHIVLPRTAALKVMHLTPQYLRGMAIQMMREACILESLPCPGTPRIFECGMLADRRPWIAMEHIAGPSLAEVMSDGPLQPADVAAVLVEVSETLAKLHALGAVHGRITEDSIVRSTSGRSALRDWSNAGTVDSERAQFDTSDDVYMLGLAAFHASTGGGLDQAATNAPTELLALIDEMLDPDPDLRPTATDVHRRASAFDISPARERRWTPVHGSAPLGIDGNARPPVRVKPSS